MTSRFGNPLTAALHDLPAEMTVLLTHVIDGDEACVIAVVDPDGPAYAVVTTCSRDDNGTWSAGTSGEAEGQGGIDSWVFFCERVPAGVGEAYLNYKGKRHRLAARSGWVAFCQRDPAWSLIDPLLRMESFPT